MVNNISSAVQIQSNISEVNGVNNTLQNSIQAYFNEVEKQSTNTATNYKCWFEDFFQFVFNKGVDFITWQDISNREYINVTMIRNYRNHLKDKGNGNSTVNNKLSAIKNLFKQLNLCEVVNLNLAAFELKRLKENEDNTYGTLSDKEITDLFEYCKQEVNNPMVKYLLFKTLYITAYRIEAVRELKWKDIRKNIDRESGTEVWTIVGKNNSSKHNFVKAISDSFYEELIQLKGNKGNDAYVFAPSYNNVPISKITLGKIFENYCEAYGLDKKGRNLVIHSIKHSSATKACKMTGNDVKKVQSHANHLHATTTFDSYINQDIPLTQQVSYIIDQEIDRNVFDGLDRESLLKLIKGVNDGVFMDLVRLGKSKGIVK